MDVVNKLFSTVSSTVSQLSSVLPGNPVTREFEATSHIASAGPGLLWKIYSGYKKSTKQDAAIFVFEKRLLERWPRADRDAILDMLRRGVSQLTKLRHPQILTVQHPLEESRESLAFATEPVFASLANILGFTENMPSPIPSQLENFKLLEVEIKYGLLQVGEGLAFLHNDVRLLHRNLSPEVIIINQQGAWKIFGFDFCQHSTSQQNAKPYWPSIEYNIHSSALTQPCLDYLAPEFMNTQCHTPASDMYSLGVLIYSLYNEGQPLHCCNGSWSEYKRHASEIKKLPPHKLQCVAVGLRDYVKMMLNTEPELRPDAHQFIKIEYFEDVGVKTLNYLDSLFQWDNLQKSQFYKGLPQIIPTLPHRVCIFRIVPCLSKEFLNPTMVPFVLPNVLLIAENCSKEEYIQHVLPVIKPVMKMQEPIQILLIFMQKMELLLKLTPAAEIKSDVLPMLYRALESDAQQIQELCLSVLPTYAALIDYPAMKNALLPRIKRLCISTSYLSVRVNCLVCIGKLLEHLDKWLVLDEVVPFLPQIPSREPAVLMGILGIYKLALTHKKLGITKELMANKILPFLMPLSIENGLTLNQFNALISLIKEMVNRVEIDHRSKLEQLNSIQQEQKTVPINPSSLLVPAPAPTTDTDDMFSNLGIDMYLGGPSLQSAPTSPILLSSSPVVVTTSSNGIDTNLNSHELTIEEKQRIMKQQEMQQKMKSVSSLSPKPSASHVKVTAPKDLTSTLMEHNVAQMKYSKPIQSTDMTQLTWQQTPYRPTVPVSNNFGAFQAAPIVNQHPMTTWQSSPQIPTQWGTTLSGLPSQQPTSFGSLSSSNPIFSPNMKQLDISQNQTPKPLSSAEINDLLS